MRPVWQTILRMSQELSYHVVKEWLFVHAVAGVEDDGRQQNVEENLRIEGGRFLNVDVHILNAAVVLKPG